MAQKKKTAAYIRKAVEKYDQKFDRVAVRLPSGYADIIRDRLGMSCNAYFVELCEDDFRRRGLLGDDGRPVEDSAAGSRQAGL